MVEQNLNSEVLEIDHKPFSTLALVLKVTSFCLETVVTKMVNPLNPNIKIQISICCPYTFPIKEVVRGC